MCSYFGIKGALWIESDPIEYRASGTMSIEECVGITVSVSMLLYYDCDEFIAAFGFPTSLLPAMPVQ